MGLVYHITHTDFNKSNLYDQRVLWLDIQDVDIEFFWSLPTHSNSLFIIRSQVNDSHWLPKLLFRVYWLTLSSFFSPPAPPPDWFCPWQRQRKKISPGFIVLLISIFIIIIFIVKSLLRHNCQMKVKNECKKQDRWGNRASLLSLQQQFIQFTQKLFSKHNTHDHFSIIIKDLKDIIIFKP